MWSPIQAFLSLLHLPSSFLHFISPFCGTRCSVSKSHKSVLEHCLKSQMSGWILKLPCVKSPDHLIALLESSQLDLYFGNHQSVVTADICTVLDSYPVGRKSSILVLLSGEQSEWLSCVHWRSWLSYVCPCVGRQMSES